MYLYIYVFIYAKTSTKIISFFWSIDCGINVKFKRITLMLKKLYPVSSKQDCKDLISSRQGLVVE